MDSFLQKFSLQNLLRQFFCGVVFFVPLWLFSKNAECPCCTCSVVDVTKWGTGTLLLFAALASIIGTIIYHLEKNLYSYPLMYVYERWIFKGNETDSDGEKEQGKLTTPPERKFHIWLVWIVVAVIVMLGLLGCRHFVSWPWIAFLVFAGLWLFVVTHLLLERDAVLPITMKVWGIEYLSAKHRAGESSEPDDEAIMRYAAVEKIATWSDFIHCVQSCCFAWIFGSLLAYYITGTIVRGFYQGMTLAFMLLAAEMIIDIHRYRFVKCLLKESGVSNNSFQREIAKKESNHPVWGDYPEFKEYDNANIVTAKKDVKRSWKKTFAHRCWMNIPQWKLAQFKDAPFIFDCLVDGKRFVWTAPSAALRAVFECKHLRKAKKKGNPYALYLDYATGEIYNSPSQSDDSCICRLTKVEKAASYFLFRQVQQLPPLFVERYNSSQLPECGKYRGSNYCMSKSLQKSGLCFFNFPPQKLCDFREHSFIFDCDIVGKRRMWCISCQLLEAYCQQLDLIERKDLTKSYSLYIDYNTGAAYASNDASCAPLFYLFPVLEGTAFSLLYLDSLK